MPSLFGEYTGFAPTAPQGCTIGTVLFFLAGCGEVWPSTHPKLQKQSVTPITANHILWGVTYYTKPNHLPCIRIRWMRSTAAAPSEESKGITSSSSANRDNSRGNRYFKKCTCNAPPCLTQAVLTSSTTPPRTPKPLVLRGLLISITYPTFRLLCNGILGRPCGLSLRLKRYSSYH